MLYKHAFVALFLPLPAAIRKDKSISSSESNFDQIFMEFFPWQKFKIGFRLPTFSYNTQPASFNWNLQRYIITFYYDTSVRFIFPGTLISEKVPHALSRITVINEIPSNKN